jgi:hypothetical protein
MEICDVIWVEYDKNKNFKDIHSTIVINVYKHYKDSYWCKDFLHMTYFEKDSLSIFLHYNIMQHLIRSKKKIDDFFNVQMKTYQEYFQINTH